MLTMCNRNVRHQEVNPAIFPDLTYSSCASQGKAIYDTLDGTCKDCAAGMVADPSVLDSVGNAVQCKCAQGYYSGSVNCFGTTDGSCKKLTCTQCSVTDSNKPTSHSDGSGCAACGASTSGFSSSKQECECADGIMLVEKDINGAWASSKS